MRAGLRKPTVVGRVKDPALLADRRRQLVDAATEVFAKSGFDRASVDRIAERCGWSVGALYRYVRSKDDILFLVCDEIFRQIGPDRLAGPEGMDPSRRFEQAYTAYCEGIYERRRQVLLMYREYGHLSRAAQRHFMMLETEVRDKLRLLIDDGVRGQVFTCEDPSLFATDCIVRAHMVALKNWTLANRDPAVVRNRLVEWTLRALDAGA